jgi:hypothetical protein
MSYARVVLAFEEVDVVKQTSGEEQSPVDSRPDVGVVKASLGAFKPFLEFYESLSFILWFTALSN